MSYAPPPANSSGSASPGPPGQAAPQYSPDGRWYWDGVRWQPVASPAPLWSRPYAPPEGRGTAVVAMVCLAMAGAGLFFIGEAIDLLAAVAAPASILDTISAGFELIAVLASVSGLVATAIAVPMWMHRAFRNLPALGETNLRWSPAWAAGGWFIPFANLVIPFMVARELWIRTVGAAAPGWPLLPIWWAAWVGANAFQGVSNSVGRVSRAGGDVFGLLNDAGLLLAGGLLIVIVQTVTRAQRARRSEVATGG